MQIRGIGAIAVASIGLIVSSALGESTADAMRSFGLIGTWSADCSVDYNRACITKDECLAARFTFSVPVFGRPTREIVAPTIGGKPFRNSIEIKEANRITEDKIRIVTISSQELQGHAQYVSPVKGEEWETVYMRNGNKLKLWTAQ